ncbi:YodL domain-containing protein [Agathobaculum butyriciproducens]
MDDSSNVFQSNTQTAAPTSDVFDWNTPDVSDEVINRVLTAGSNSTHSRERIAAFFMQPNVSMADAAAFLRREYRVGGAGVRVHNIDHSLWFDGNGLRIARGHDTRTPRAAVLTYEDAANRISTLLKNGQYASAAELTDAKPNEYRELASEIWHTYHDMSEEAREQGFFAQTKEFANDVFPSAVKKLTAALSDPAQRTVLTGEMADYARAVQQNSDLCRFRFNVQRSEDAAERLQRTEHMTALYAAADGFEPARATFITQDEIDEMLRSGSGIERGKKRISEFYAENHTQKERIEFLKNEYGWGGRAYGGYSENHDGKGIAFERSDADGVYDKVTLSWSQVDHQIGTLIRQNRYLTPEEQQRYEVERLAALDASEPQMDIVEDDDFPDINPAEVREALARNGIVNGEVVEPEKLNSNPFIQQVISDVESVSQNDVFQSNTQKQQAPVDTPNDYNSIKLNASYADSIVLFQVGDFFEMFGEDAKQAAALLELNLTTRELPGTGRVEMCGIPAHSLERYVEKLRDKHDVTIAATKGKSTERHVYTMRSIDHEAEDAINAYETEFGADGLRAFRDTSAETQANVFQSNTRSAEPTQPKQFIAHFYVAEDIQKRGALDIKKFHSLEDALNAYHKLPNNQRKALGAMNTEDLPGSLDFVQCVDGKDTIIQDYTKVAGWQNAEVLNSIAQIERSLNTREAVSVPTKNVFQSNTPEEPDSDRYEIYQLTADPANAKLLFTSYDGIHAGGMTINRSNYELKYSAPLTPDTTLDSIYVQFNINHPADFTGHSLSVSDIVVLHRNGQDTAHYVDSIGFADVPEFLTEQTQENVFQRNTPPERDVFEGNSPAERAELAASDPDNDVFDGNTLTEAVQSAEAHTAEDSDLKTAKQLINDYCIEEFDTMADFSDLSDVGLAYSTTEDGQHKIQVSADLKAYSLNYAVDNEIVFSIPSDSLDNFNDLLTDLYFDGLIGRAEHEYYRLHPNEETVDTVAVNSPAESVEAHTPEDNEVELAKRLINNYWNAEFSRNADFSDLSNVHLGSDTTADGQHEIQVSADLNAYCINYAVDNEIVRSTSCDDLEELNELLANLYFDSLIGRAADYYYARHPENNDLRHAKVNINNYWKKEFGNDKNADFSDLSNVSLASSITADGQHEIQVSADLNDYRINYAVDNEIVRSIQCDSLEELNGHLENLYFSSLIRDAEYAYYQLYPNERTVDTIDMDCPTERAKLAASAQNNDVFQENTLAEAVESTETHTVEDSDLKTAKQLINDYCIEEFDTMADFSDLSDVGLAYSTTEDDEHEIQVSADLNTYCINYAVDGETVHSVPFNSLHELNDHFANLYFDAMISDAEYYYYELHPNETTENVFQSNTSADNSIMVRCEWSESSAFEDGKVYPLAEFDRLMKKADEDFVSGRENIEQKYGSLENAFDAGYEEAYQYAGYNKTKFTLLLPDGRTFTERQDIGDGDGGLLDFLSQYPAYNDIMPMLREAAGSTPESENVFQSNTQDTPTSETADVFQSNTPAYQVGDTVYLDNKPFEITDIRDFHVELRDPSLLYPVSRLENRDNFTQLLAQDERNVAPAVFQLNTQETAQTDGAQQVSIMIMASGQMSLGAGGRTSLA